MVGPQQGSRSDYGLTFREPVLNVRIIWFLLIGVLVFLAITYRDVVRRYASRPGCAAADRRRAGRCWPRTSSCAGTTRSATTASSPVCADAVGQTGGHRAAGAGLLRLAVVGLAARARGRHLRGDRPPAALAGLGVRRARRRSSGVIALLAHAAAAAAGGGIDHSFGAPDGVHRLPDPRRRRRAGRPVAGGDGRHPRVRRARDGLPPRPARWSCWAWCSGSSP